MDEFHFNCMNFMIHLEILEEVNPKPSKVPVGMFPVITYLMYDRTRRITKKIVESVDCMTPTASQQLALLGVDTQVQAVVGKAGRIWNTKELNNVS